MTIRIVTDSTCDLPQATIDHYGITVLPLHINFAGESLLDGVEVSKAEFYERLPACHPAPTTSAPGAAVFERTYMDLAQGGASEILSIHISATLSAVTDVARVAAAEHQGVPVHVIDSGQLGFGVGLVVDAAARAIADGLGLSDVLGRIEDRIRHTHVFAALDTLEYLKRSGRMNGVLAGLGSILQIKPILRMHGGKAVAERVRTRGRALHRLLEILQGLGPIEQAALIHANALERAESFLALARPWLPTGPIPRVEITPTIGAHGGPGVVGLAVVTAGKASSGGQS